MEEVVLRFPRLIEKIFAQLNNISLARCKEVSKTWRGFLDQQKFLRVRSIQSYIGKKHAIGDPWMKIFKISNTEMIILLEHAVKKVFSKDFLGDKGIILHPLHVAAMYDQQYLYKYLEKKLGDDSGKCILGGTLHFAAGFGHLDMCKYIMENTEDKNPRCNIGLTPLHCAAQEGRLNVCTYIMANTEDKNPRSNDGRTPLHFAALNGHLDVCKYIMENTEGKSPKTNSGETPLHKAAWNGHMDVFQYIIENTEDISSRNNLGQKPICIAHLRNHLKVVKFMQSYSFEPKLKRRKGEKGEEF